MSTQVQRRKGTTAQHASFTGASAELTVDTTKNTVVVHNGATAGGIPLAKETGSAISATSLSLPNSTTNGVAYLNGSKVLTTGSALVFDGSGNLGIGTSSPGAKLDVSGAGNLFLSNQNNAVSNSQQLPGYLAFTGAGWNTATASQPISGRITFAGAYDSAVGNVLPYLAFSLQPSNGSITEKVRIDSNGNLGIGTSSPLSKLTVAQSANGFDQGLTFTSAGAYRGTIFLNGSNDTLNFGRSTSTSMTIDTSGNLGIGTSSPGAKLDVNGDALIQGLTVGRGAGAVATNTAVGASALAANTAGLLSTAVGRTALVANISGTENTAIGANTLQSSATGNFNVALGTYALVLANGTTSNTALGAYAGYGITTGSKNVVLGAYRGALAPISATGSNYIVFSDGDANVRGYYDSTGNLVVPVAAKGINFTANSPAAGMTSQLLNWFEEGTWTPAYTPTTGAFGTIGAVTSGTYTRVGKRVYFEAALRTTGTPSLGTAGGRLLITGLPFTASASGGQGQASAIQQWNLAAAFTNLGVSVLASTTTLIINKNSSNSDVTYVQATELSIATSNFGNLISIFGSYLI